MKTVLIIAPHCDDEVLGCGGIISKRVVEGDDVHICIVTNGHIGAPELFKKEGTERVRTEALKSHSFLGVKSTSFLDFPAPRLDDIPSYKLSMAIEKIVREKGVTDLYIPHRGDIHKDHRITYEAALVAARPINKNPVKRIYAYETLSETEWAAPFPDEAFIPTVFENIDDHIDRKIEAFDFFETQRKSFPHPRSGDAIRYLASLRGSTVGFHAAEAFMLIREIL